MIVPAHAQSNPPATTRAPATPPAATSTTTPSATPSASQSSTSQAGEWRASKLMGVDVYNDQNEKLGDISEILLDKSGKIDGVIIGVGGFLGVGERDIKVEMSQLKFVDQPVRSSSTTSTTGTGTAARTGTTTTSSANDKNKWYPDHAVLSGATKEQLKAMPEFKY
jgi:sporulation protein YlmC with PRC-barrel domain